MVRIKRQFALLLWEEGWPWANWCHHPGGVYNWWVARVAPFHPRPSLSLCPSFPHIHLIHHHCFIYNRIVQDKFNPNNALHKNIKIFFSVFMYVPVEELVPVCDKCVHRHRPIVLDKFNVMLVYPWYCTVMFNNPVTPYATDSKIMRHGRCCAKNCSYDSLDWLPFIHIGQDYWL